LKPYIALPFTAILKQIAKQRVKKHPVVQLDLKSISISDDVYKLEVNKFDPGLSTQLHAFRFREPANVYALSKFIRNNDFDLVADVGSNIGYFPFIEHASKAKKIVAIEPVPETYQVLVNNTRRYENIVTHNVAVGSESGTVTMYVPNYRNLATLLEIANLRNQEIQHKFRLEKTLEVKVEPLEKFVAGYNSVLVRMDVEGYEKEITKTLPEEVCALSFELHAFILGSEGTYALIKNLWQQNFKIETAITGIGRSFASITKIFGIKKALKLYSLFHAPFILRYPTKSTVKKLITRMQHVFLIRKPN